MNPEKLLSVMEATWVPASTARQGPWTIRNGLGGGKRVSAATAEAAWQDTDIPQAEAAMAALDQPALFLIREGDGMLDQALMARGYRIVDPVVAYAAPLSILPQPPDPMTTFPHWPPMAIASDLWAEGGIGAARLAVMARVTGPKTAILARAQDRAAGAAFVAMNDKVAMLHALEVTPSQRRQGSAHNILRAAVVWAQANGADTLSLVVTVANDPARRLYASLGMTVVGHYHYRQK
ncbi:N-acetyltransferase [Cypionkella aquatica]|uniref:N-acetyltransferase n=1 Tax=Cypionkella aquatica TaxID=1756042 RepID=A0AA37TNU0_9RHOB|nr:GNAT family N-acetyltransferase [Cypionkella aquatica]GLS85244.1 N-acetyltransferase [Cypionkella aquatica]